MKDIKQNTVIDFEADLKKYAAAFQKDLRTAVRNILFRLARKIIERTPVDEGRAQGSWDIERQRIGNFELSEGTGSDSSAEALTRIRTKISTGEVLDLWYIYNNLPYIEVLEFGLYPGDGPKTQDGFSIQAPAGMVRVSIADLQTEMLEEIRRIK